MSPHVVTIGAALGGNKGAAAMLETTIRGLRERVPGTTFTLLSMYPEDDRERTADDDGIEVVDATPAKLGVVINTFALLYRLVPPLRPWIRRRSPAVDALARGSVLVDLGGITFSDGREKFLLYNVASILPAMLVGTPVFKCAQAIGPFTSRVNRTVSRLFLPRVHTIVTRGRITHEFATEFGLDNIVAGADLALALDELGSDAAPDVTAQRSLVGVAPSAVMRGKVDGAGGDYAGDMAALIDALARDHDVLLVPHSARPGTDKEHNNDLPVCRDILARLRQADAVTFVDGDVSAGDLRAVIARCDVFVTSRFHAMVSALATGTPTLVLGWSHKYREVLEMFGVEEWALDGATASAEEVQERFDALWDRRGEVASQIATALGPVRSRSAEQLDLLADVALGRS